MDRRSWLWRKRSSEKSPGETESSGSISSHSERFSDEQELQQANVTYNTQSPEVIFTPTPDEEENAKIKALSDQLADAQSEITAKEELVKQHAKVAEEAVAGWERAEREVASLKLQLDTALKKTSALDGALKECVRQLRQGKEDKELKIEEAIQKREREWESRQSELEKQLSELRIQLEAAKLEVAPSRSMDAAEKENASLRRELVALSKKLETATIERDLSTQSAETASKQHLESVKKIAKLEAECRRLRYFTHKASLPSDHRSVTGSSVNLDSVTDNQSDCGERLQALETDIRKIRCIDQNEERKPVNRSSESVLMDDFLEMERLAGLPDTENKVVSDTSNEAMITRNADLEEKIRSLEAEKLKLQMAVTEFQAKLRTSNEQLKATKNELISVQHEVYECQDQLRKSQAKLKGTETELIEVQTQLIENEDQLNTSESLLKDSEAKLKELQIQSSAREVQLKTSQGVLKDAEAMLMELQMKLIEREDQLKTSQSQLEHTKAELKRSQGQVKDKDSQLLEMETRLIEYQDEVEKSREQTIHVDTKLVELQKELALINKIYEDVKGELKTSNARREEAELQVEALESEMKSLLDETDKERALSAEITAKCRKLEDELSRRKFEPQFQLAWNCNADMKAEQEKELAVAASKLADCQKTIASLGRQLQSLATLDDFLEDADSCMEFSEGSPIFFKTGELPPSIDCQ